MPDPHADAVRAAAIHKQLSPPAVVGMSPSWQEPGIRRSRPLPYALTVREAIVDGAIHFRFAAEGEQAEGKQAAVFHVPDRTDLAQAPRRFIVEPAYALNGGRSVPTGATISGCLARMGFTGTSWGTGTIRNCCPGWSGAQLRPR